MHKAHRIAAHRIAGAFRTGDWYYTYGGDGKCTWLATAKRIEIHAAGEGGFRCST